jgi:Fe-S cluster assembly protein SufD
MHEIPQELKFGPDWLWQQRQAFLNAYIDTPLPLRSNHLWRYTDPIRFLVGDGTEINGLPDGKGFSSKTDLAVQVENNLLDGYAVDTGNASIRCRSSRQITSSGAVIASLAEAFETHGELVKKHLCQLVNDRTGKFEALNGALWQNGIFIYVPSGVTIERPIQIVHQGASDSSQRFHRLLVVCEDNTELSLIDEYCGGSSDVIASSRVNSAVEIFGSERSRINYVPLQQHGSAVTSYLTYRAQIQRGGQMQTIPMAFGGALSKQSLGIILNGPGAESNIAGLIFGTKRQHFDNYTLHHHRSGHTQSNIDLKVVLKDRAKSAYTGLIRIEQDAAACEAYQENRNLILSKGAKAETIPELEILNEEVSCTHGATVGPIDPEMVFYSKSRGVDQEQATRMIISGFVSSTLKLVPKNLRDRIEALVMHRLESF